MGTLPQGNSWLVFSISKTMPENGCWIFSEKFSKKFLDSSPRILGILEYHSQSNDSASCVGQDERLKFVKDLAILEVINIIIMGLCSVHGKARVPIGVREDNQLIPTKHLQSHDENKYHQDKNNAFQFHTKIPILVPNCTYIMNN